MNPKRQAILDKSKGHCWYCGLDLTDQKWHEDHFYPVVRIAGKMIYPELDIEENKVPSCAPCNNFKSSADIEGFRFLVNEQFQNVLRNSTGARQLLRLGLMEISPKPVQFWFEKQGYSMKSEFELMNFSDEAKNKVWVKDENEYEYYSTSFGDFLLTLRNLGSEWLAIAIDYDWKKLGETKLPNGRLAKLQAVDWALNLNVTR